MAGEVDALECSVYDDERHDDVTTAQPTSSGREQPFSSRGASLSDDGTVLRMLDDAVSWLCARGRARQWGASPVSASPDRVANIRAWLALGDSSLATRGSSVVGAMLLGPAPPHVPPAEDDELFILLLLGERTARARGAGGYLLARARELARDRGIGTMRLSCWAGGDQRLVRYYEAHGFARAGEFDVRGWPGQVMKTDV